MIQLAWHVHHDVLVEPLSAPLEERIAYIKEHKPQEEQELRLRLLKPVVGMLPDAVLKAVDAYTKARDAYTTAGDAYTTAGDAYAKAWDAYDKVISGDQEAIESLHAQECPDCPWDGQTIFSEGG